MPGLGPNLHLEARIEGDQADFTLSDGTRTYSMAYTIQKNNHAARVGLYSRHSGTGSDGVKLTQRYDNFVVSSLDQKVLCEDPFDGPDGPPARWDGARRPNRMPLYQREHMRRDKAPIKKKTRFAPNLKVEH